MSNMLLFLCVRDQMRKKENRTDVNLNTENFLGMKMKFLKTLPRKTVFFDRLRLIRLNLTDDSLVNGFTSTRSRTQIQFAQLLPSSQMALCPATLPNVCNLICVWLLWHHVSSLRLNQAHLDNQFPVTSLSLNLLGGVAWSQQIRKSDMKMDEMWLRLPLLEQRNKSTSLPMLMLANHFKWCHVYSGWLHKGKRQILLYQRCNTQSSSSWTEAFSSIKTVTLMTKMPHNSGWQSLQSHTEIRHCYCIISPGKSLSACDINVQFKQDMKLDIKI